MDETTTETSADAPQGPIEREGRSVFVPAPDDGDGPRSPGHLASDDDPGAPRRRWLVPLLLLPLVLVGVLVIGWAIDTSSGGVARNVALAGRDVGDLSESALARAVDTMADDFGSTTIEIVSGDATYSTTAADLGLMIDEDRTAKRVLDVDDETFPLARPFVWAMSFVSERSAGIEFQVSREKVAATLIELQGDDRTPPVEPTVELVEGEFQVVPGTPGRGIDPERLAAALPEAAADWSDDESLRVEIERVALPPLGSEAAAREAAEAAEAIVSEPIEVRTPGGARTVGPDELRTWVTLASEDDGSVVVDLDAGRVAAGLRQHFADIEGRPVDAGFSLGSDGVPFITPDAPGLICCADGSADRIIEELRAGRRAVDLELVEGPAAFTVADAQAWGITQAVGGNHAWRNGAPTTAGPGFTTYHAAGGNRVANIHRMADLVRGAVVAPGATFSINEHVGQRTAEKGFLPAGAIRDGEHVDEIGGGVSQFATTMFNAAYFAGLEIVTSQAHSEYFDRYPYGREATMGFPAPDLAWKNDTPYGILVWTSYTDTSLTVTLFSTPYATGEQTGLSESRSGACRVVTTTRTRTFPDGRTEQDKFRATYRPGPGIRC